MDFILTVLSVIFVALVLAVALTFGFALLIWFLAIALVIACVVFAREWWRRWYFLRNAAPREQPPKVIDGDYKDITHR